METIESGHDPVLIAVGAVAPLYPPDLAAPGVRARSGITYVRRTGVLGRSAERSSRMGTKVEVRSYEAHVAL